MTEITCNGTGGLPEPELVERLRRRRSSADYRLRILREADGCLTPGEVGALLRREGLYMSHLTHWRTQREAGALQVVSHTLGRKPAKRRDVEIADLERRLERVEAALDGARKGRP